jgi:sugar phosphate isomerase/epimerase
MDYPIVALNAHWHTYPERFAWIVEHGFALEYSPNPEAFDAMPMHLDTLLTAGVPVRHHAFFPRYELGHADVSTAERALSIHLAALAAIRRRGEQVLTIHIGLDREAPLDPHRAVSNLTRLVEAARVLGITICLENLRSGPTSNPETVREWARASGAMITLDVGHAVSSQRVQHGELTPCDFVAQFADRLCEAHMYEREVDRHYPPRDMRVLGPVVDGLLNTQCRWWTIELDRCDEALETRRLLLDYLREGDNRRR